MIYTESCIHTFGFERIFLEKVFLQVKSICSGILRKFYDRH